jgi:hypothetical protein
MKHMLDGLSLMKHMLDGLSLMKHMLDRVFACWLSIKVSKISAQFAFSYTKKMHVYTVFGTSDLLATELCHLTLWLFWKMW